MGAGISTSVPESRLQAYLPPPRATTTAFFPPPPPPTAAPLVFSPEPTMITTFNANRVLAFHSSAKWRAYLDSSKYSNKLIVVDFTATWCGPCKLMEPAFDELSSKFSDVEFVKIDVDELMDVSRQYGIQVMPTFLFIKKGQEIDKVVGVKKEELQRKIELHRLNNYSSNNNNYYNNGCYYQY